MIQELLRSQLRRGEISRRQFLQNMIVAGMGLGGVSVLSSCGGAAPTAAPAQQEAAAPATEAPKEEAPAAASGARPLTPTFYQWIVDLHPGLKAVNESFADLNFQIAPVAGFDVARFVAEGKNKESTWDVYVGMTPFVEMAALIKADVIEPWDNYIPKDVLDDIIPSIREECTVDGKLYSWPFLLDIIVQGYNTSITSKAGLPDTPPADWDEYLANSKAVLDSGAARYGCTFDAHGWRSLCPITHSISTDVYYMLDGDASGVPLFDFTSEPALQALEIMKQMLDLSSANALQPGSTDGGVNQTPDEVAFAAQQVAYYIKYQNAPLRMAGTWTDPAALRLGALPKAKGGAGSTVFWTTGACLFKWGQNKEKAAEYMKALTYDAQIWKDSIAGSSSGHPGQLPPFLSVNEALQKENADWFQKETWVPLIFEQLKVAKAIPNHAFGLQQFILAQPIWEKYLKGESTDAKAVMQEAKDAVAAEVKKAG
ncbi:MAG: ABC transporter substrate-binding protein [Anaerolineae bacterium]|nr:ABC transporter substrate-binding protein [Anaerolineales bacterium]MCQ3976557.1 ABC transporter substrate-binding protein [Anaerolineae bacterium]